MPGQKQASEIVALMRYYLKEMGTEPYRDGFSTDVSTSPSLIPILPFANRAYGIFGRAGFNTGNFTATITPGTREYSIDPNAGKIDSATATFSGITYTIRNTTTELLDSRVRDWRQQRDPSDPDYPHYAGRSRQYYTQGRWIGLWPMPDGSGQLGYRAYASPPDMTQPTDVPSGVPSDYHGGIAMLGAAIWAISDADDDNMAARAQALLAQFEMEYPGLKDLIDARSVIDIIARQKPQGQDDGGLS